MGTVSVGTNETYCTMPMARDPFRIVMFTGSEYVLNSDSGV